MLASRAMISSFAALAIGLVAGVPFAAAQCAQPSGNGQLYNPTGPNLDGASSQNIAGSFFAADNITISANGTITSLCFWGRYASANVPAAGVEQFRVTFYSDAGGYPSATAFAGPFTITQAGAGLTRAVVSNAANSFVWSANIAPGVSVTAGQCLWMEIVGDTPGALLADRWRWSVNNNAAALPFKDGFAYQVATGGIYSPASRIGVDFSWALNVAVTTPGCQFSPAANSLCSAAQAVAVPSTLPAINGTRGQLVTTIPCKGSSVSGPGLWYSVVGNGTTYTASSCGNTNYDTVLAVYCGTCAGSDNSGLNCVGSNDTGPITCVGVDSALVSWPTTAGLTYYVNVFGYQQAAGTILDLQFATTGTQAATHPPCASDFCPVDLAGIPAASFEPDACAADTNGADCSTASSPGIRTIILGQTVAGTVQSAGSSRDRDFWELSGLAPHTAYRLTASAELPTSIYTLNGACVAGSSIGTANISGLLTYCDAFQRDWTTDATGIARVLVTTSEYFGLPCSLNRNEYKFSVSAAPAGSCCQPITSCQVTSQAICNAVVGAVWNSGGTCTPTDACNGICCTGSACVLASVGQCTAAGAIFVAGGTCSPNPCVATAVCCRGATCATTFASAAACSGSLIAGQTAGAVFPSGSACNAGGTATPCCYADYNKVNSINVQDIFDYLSDWFAGSPYARVGSNGGAGALAVQNIFDFLSAWFAGGC